MPIVAIDPGTRNTGLVYMDEHRIICCKTLTYKSTIKQDQDELMARAYNIAKQLLNWIGDKPHECIVIEGFCSFGYSGRANASTFQTPYLVGFLHRALSGEVVVTQTSRQVFNPKVKGNLLSLRDRMALGYEVYPECAKCTNEHLRAAAVHGIYYYKNRVEYDA